MRNRAKGGPDQIRTNELTDIIRLNESDVRESNPRYLLGKQM